MIICILASHVQQNKSQNNHLIAHYSTGDAFPANLPTAADKLVLLSMRFCPYAQRAHLVLDAKHIAHDIVNIHLKQKPEWLTEYSRLGKVPALGLTNEPGSPYIYESLLIADYLDEKFPQRRLYPTDALAKTQERLWIERFNGVISAFYKIVLGSGDQQAVDAFDAALEPFEAELARRGTRFFAGDAQPGMLDYMIWPWIERTAGLALQEAAEVKFQLTAERYPALVRYVAAMWQDEAVKKTALTGEVHYKFIVGHVSGTPDYELLHKL